MPKKAFCRAFNGIFGKVGRVASENVLVELVIKKCLPVLIYGTEACAMSNAHIVIELCSNLQFQENI